MKRQEQMTQEKQKLEVQEHVKQTSAMSLLFEAEKEAIHLVAFVWVYEPHASFVILALSKPCNCLLRAKELIINSAAAASKSYTETLESANEVGNALLLKLDELLESYSIKKNITEATKMSSNCVLVLDLCVKCNNHISEGRFYLALKTIDLIKKVYLQNIPVKALRMLIEERIPIIKSYIEKKVISQVIEDMLARQRKAEEQSYSRSEDFTYTLDVEEINEDFVLKFDLTPVYWAYHIHTCLGIPEQFRDYYYKNRLLQLNSDLQISSAQPFPKTDVVITRDDVKFVDLTCPSSAQLVPSAKKHSQTSFISFTTEKPGTLWASGIGASLAYSRAKTPLKPSLRLIHARMHAQALTLAVLSGAAVYHYYEKRLGEPSEK
ncbi:hypothetical protein TEA_010178 [Camellia sinensis var. sinensis]|uniref:HIG1 domain-containing protein n=1 Tax=Camellia sinensis var. sinensis TaxID=542762 RepID=A0A4S4D387_CAMSN|nr:hypothetical protein TEA_010178 [Camellia sinensis var. sinensis]